MAKLFNTRSELIALRSICSPDAVVSGYMLAHLDDSYFYNDESIEVFNSLKTSFNKRGSVPRFKTLIEDIRLSDSARELLAEADTPVKDHTQAEHLVRSLGNLRKTRLFYLLARDVLSNLEKPKVDIEALTDEIAKKMSRIHSARMGDADIIHFGKDSNAFELVHDQLYNDKDDSVIPTGFDTWDSVNGGVIRGSLFVIGGSSGGGKCSVPETEVEVLQSVTITSEDGLTERTYLPHEEVRVLRGGAIVFVPAFSLTDTDELIL